MTSCPIKENPLSSRSTRVLILLRPPKKVGTWSKKISSMLNQRSWELGSCDKLCALFFSDQFARAVESAAGREEFVEYTVSRTPEVV